MPDRPTSWICDDCGEPIERPEHGWMDYLRDAEGKAHSFRIIHHILHSPRRDGQTCCYPEELQPEDCRLTDVLPDGPVGISFFLALLDPGRAGGGGRGHPPGAHLPDVIEVMRRLYVSGYEEARAQRG